VSFPNRFLARADWFPSTADGEPWGEERLCLDIGGPTPIGGLSPQQHHALHARFEAESTRTAPPNDASFSIQLRRLPSSAFRVFERRGWVYTLDADPGPDQIRVAGYGFAGIVRLHGDRTALLWTAEQQERAFLTLFENFFRVLLANRTLSNGGVILHSAGVVGDDGARVFFGHSGAGKSTLARLALASGRRILSDDLNLIEAGDPPRVRRIPFAGELAQVTAERPDYPLAGLYQLRQGEHGIMPLSPGMAQAALLASAPFVNRDPFRLPQLLDNLARLSRAYPVNALSFRKDRVRWDLIDQSAMVRAADPTPRRIP
jgi:hypothetical protein